MPSTTTEGGMPVVTVKVSSFLKHPAAGHTLYECRVELPHTRQVWVVHRRYREFVALRQHLKTACQHYRQKKPAPSSRGGKPHPANKPPGRGTASLGVGGDVSAAAAGGDGGGSSGGGSSAGFRPPGSAELVESIETILFVCKFPSRIALGRSFSLKQERRKALHSFLEALVYLRPLPNKVASFLGLLENNRLAQDQNGDYVRVMHTETVLPIPPSPAFHAAARARREKMVADVAPRGGEDDDAAVAGDDGPCGTTPGLRSSKAAATKTLAVGVASAEGRAEEGSDVPAAAAEVATGCSSSSGGGGSENDGRRKASLPLSSPAAAGTAGASGQPLSDHVNSSSPRQHQPPRFRQQEQRSVGSRAWEGVRTAAMGSGGGKTGGRARKTPRTRSLVLTRRRTMTATTTTGGGPARQKTPPTFAGMMTRSSDHHRGLGGSSSSSSSSSGSSGRGPTVAWHTGVLTLPRLPRLSQRPAWATRIVAEGVVAASRGLFRTRHYRRFRRRRPGRRPL
ncbi:unnamed protein product [Ectocarpus sp. 6 AP-2014]